MAVIPTSAVVALFAVLCCGLIATGVGMVFPPAGLVTAGLLGLAGLYVWGYLRAGRNGGGG